MRKLSFIPVVFIFFATACDKVEEGCKEEKYASAVVYDFPDSLQTGVTHDLKIEYILENSCGSFDEFEVAQVDDYTFVKLKTLYEGCNCTLEFTEAEEFFLISFSDTGTYKFKFWISDTDYDSYSLIIYE